jgi:serine/threonine protein kinase
MLAPNTLLQDRYLVMRLLGQGGMGAVYQATDRKFGSAVALKETFYSDDQLRKAFSQEARLLNRLRHAALPVVMDYFAIGDRQFLVMQYIPGQDLEQLLAERRARGQGVFLTSQVLLWADQLLDALEYLHSQKPPIIHRDIKPQNLKLTPRGEVILLDFGLAKGITNQQSQDSQSIRGYTPNYASLEQIRGTGTDARSDIYSIGATLYHLLTGEMPQDAMTRIAAMLMGHHDPLRPINELNPEVPPVVAGVIEKAMTPHPDKRYPSAAIMRQALRNASRNIPTSNLHRVPTLTDIPMRSKVAAAAAAVVFDPQSQPKPQSGSLNAVEEQEPSTDHYILLLEERKQEVLKRANQYRKGSNARRSASARKGSRGKKSANQLLPRSRPLLYGGIAGALMVLTIAAWLFQSPEFQNRLFRGSASVIPDMNNRSGSLTGALSPRIESLRYYLELNPGSSERARATGLKPLAAGSKFIFHFRPRDNGYIYLLALGTGGSIQTFLTDQPLSATGVTTNRIEAGREFQFPGNGLTFQIQNDSETTPFTVILSPKPIKSPAFLSALSGRDLTDAEAKELAEFKKRYATKTSEVKAIVDNDQPIVTVNVPSDRPANQPLIFDILIKRSK